MVFILQDLTLNISYLARSIRRHPQYKKHKTWDGDAVLVLKGLKGTLYDLEGKLYEPVYMLSYSSFHSKFTMIAWGQVH